MRSERSEQTNRMREKEGTDERNQPSFHPLRRNEKKKEEKAKQAEKKKDDDFKGTDDLEIPTRQ